MRILAIDPGTTESGWIAFDSCSFWPINFGKSRNEDLLASLAVNFWDVAVIEYFQSYGKPVGESTFAACAWLGRFEEAIRAASWKYPVRMLRSEVKLHLCHSTRAKDPNVRRVLLDRFPQSGGGKEPALGTKKQPGPLYGVSKDVWSALALAVTYTETEGK